MRVATVLAALSAAGLAAAHPGLARRQDDAPGVSDAPAPTEAEPTGAEPTGAEPTDAPEVSEAPAPTESGDVSDGPAPTGAPETPEEPAEPVEPVPDTPSPFEGRKLYVNPDYAEKLEATYTSFEAAGDTENAEKVRTIQDIGTFVWVSDRKGLAGIDTAIENARAAQEETGEDHIVGLVSHPALVHCDFANTGWHEGPVQPARPRLLGGRVGRRAD